MTTLVCGPQTCAPWTAVTSISTSVTLVQLHRTFCGLLEFPGKSFIRSVFLVALMITTAVAEVVGRIIANTSIKLRAGHRSKPFM